MSGKQIIVVIIAAILFGGSGAWLLSKSVANTKQEAISNNKVINSEVLPTTTPLKLLSWNDEAGFVFQYPEGILIDKHPEDEVNYANLTLSSADGLGKIEILMKDDTYKSADKWVKSDINLASGNILDTNIGDKNGKKILTKAGQTIVGIIDNGVLVTIKRESTLSPLLETTWGKIIDTWQFVYPTPSVSAKRSVVAPGQNDGGEVLEEER